MVESTLPQIENRRVLAAAVSDSFIEMPPDVRSNSSSLNREESLSNPYGVSSRLGNHKASLSGAHNNPFHQVKEKRAAALIMKQEQVP